MTIGPVMDVPKPSRALLKPGAIASNALFMVDPIHPNGVKVCPIPCVISNVFSTNPWNEGFVL